MCNYFHDYHLISVSIQNPSVIELFGKSIYTFRINETFRKIFKPIRKDSNFWNEYSTFKKTVTILFKTLSAIP